jgi:arabinose-5-phosphate isomerase
VALNFNFSDDWIRNEALRAISIEKEAVEQLLNRVDTSFIAAVRHILTQNGRVVVTGIGKSALIAQKIAATFNSTGTPSLYMHAADALHGDLGMIQAGDHVICLSKSGNTPEIKSLLPLIKSMGNTLIAFTGDAQSALAQAADFVIDCAVDQEACPNNLAPTSSTTVQLVMGDAIAVALLKARNFEAGDFARFHPGGALGKRLYLHVGDLLNGEKPHVQPDSNIQDIVFQISRGRVGAVAVITNQRLAGIITDGDLRRLLAKPGDYSTLTAADIMNASPKTISVQAMATEALAVLTTSKINQIPVLDGDTYLGMVHIHDLHREGIT